MNDLINLKSYKEENIILAARKQAELVIDGEEDAVPRYITAKAIIKYLEEYCKEIKDIATDEASDYGKDDSVYNDAKFSLKPSGTILDYEQDPLYAELNRQLKDRKKELKSAYDMFVKSGKMVMDSHGEITPVVGVKNESELTLNVSFK